MNKKYTIVKIKYVIFVNGTLLFTQLSHQYNWRYRLI